MIFSVTVTKFIRIGIADKNDNPPYFDKALYEAEVDENEDIQHTVLTVTAKDHDECKYFLAFYPVNCKKSARLKTYKPIRIFLLKLQVSSSIAWI